jgi:transposase
MTGRDGWVGWILDGMGRPIFVRPLVDEERLRLEVGLRSKDAFVRRRSQILLGSGRGERVPRMAELLGCDDQTVRNAIREFEDEGLDACLTPGKCGPKTSRARFDAAALEKLQALLHRSPREFGKSASIWTLELVAEVSCSSGIIAERVSDETIRSALKRLGVRWKRAKHWITSPDPEYARKKGVATV